MKSVKNVKNAKNLDCINGLECGDKITKNLDKIG